MSEGFAWVRKFGARQSISREQAVDYGLLEPTADELRLREARHLEYERRKQVAAEAAAVFTATLAAVSDPVARAVLDLHQADRFGCLGDDYGGYEGESPEWPCRTVSTICHALGIPVPIDLDMVVRT